MVEQLYQCRIPMGTQWCLIGSPFEICSSLDSTKNAHQNMTPDFAKNMHRGGSAKAQATLGSMGLRYLELTSWVLPVPYSYGHSVVLDW